MIKERVCRTHNVRFVCRKNENSIDGNLFILNKFIHENSCEKFENFCFVLYFILLFCCQVFVEMSLRNLGAILKYKIRIRKI